MSDRTDSGQSSAVRSGAGFPFPDLPPAPVGTETVINPERRGPAALSSQVVQPGSSLWQQLFPAEPAADAAPLESAGFELGHFAIEERIGMGGMGAVFRALDKRLQRIVALKVLSPAQSRDPAAVQRFQNEARAAARLDHDNIARVYYIGEDQGLHFIAFEYVTGTNLRDLIQETGPLHPSEAVNYTLQIAAALKHTAAAGVVHRDIKPSNIIVAPSGRAKLVDLGLARKLTPDSLGDLTIAGTTLGTFDYISPEQAKDPRSVDVRSDLYSLGCTLYHMLTGEPPYPDGTVLQKLLDHQGKDPPDPALKNGRVTPDLSAIVRKMMASDPRHRYATPDDLIRDLMPVAGAMGLRGFPPEGLIWAAPRPSRFPAWERHAGWIATVAVLLVIVFLIERFPGIGQEPEGIASPAPARGADERTVRQSPSSPETARTVRPSGTQRSGGQLPLEPPNSVPPFRIADAVGPSAKFIDRTGGRIAPPEQVAPGGPRRPERESESAHGGADEIVQATDEPAPAPVAPKQDALAPVTGSPNGSPERSPNTVADRVEAHPEPVPTVAADRASTTAQEEAKPPAETDLAEGTRPFWILASDGPEAKPTLEAACAAAKDGNIIELRYNGRRAGLAEKPLRIANKKITIRAADGFRPVVEFAIPQQPAAVGEPQMISLIDGSVDLVNVELSMRVPREADASQRWALISLEGEGSVRMQGVRATIENPFGRPAAMIELISEPGDGLPDMRMMGTGPTTGQPAYKVEVTGSLLRGTCDLFVIEHTEAGRIDLQQSVVAVERSLLYTPGMYDMPAEGAELELLLSHVTCLVGNSLIRMDSGAEPRNLVPVYVSTSRNNIFTTNTGSPLIAMSGNTDVEDFRRLLRWNGERNFYDRFDTFWVITSPQGTTKFDPRNFDGWRREWARSSSTGEVDARNGGIVWEGDWSRKEAPGITPADVALDRSDLTNPAVGAATDGTDVGADLTRFPPAAAETGE